MSLFEGSASMCSIGGGIEDCKALLLRTFGLLYVVFSNGLRWGRKVVIRVRAGSFSGS